MTNESLQISGTHSRRQLRRVAAATLIGTTVEWYDFFIYATAASLIFSTAFFQPAGDGVGILLSFTSIGVSFVFRPLGAVISGYFGDRWGRRRVLIIALVVMGASTSLIGLLPTYDSIGVGAPIMLLTLRILQGLSAGGEWGGAVLMAVEHAPDGKRSRMGMFPQLGVPFGMLLATGSMALMSGLVAPGQAFINWGWRVPFLFSVILIGVGYYVRRKLEETAVFTEIARSGKRERKPILAAAQRSGPALILAPLIVAGLTAAAYLITSGFFTNHVTSAQGSASLDRSSALFAVTISTFAYLLWVILGGYLGDAIGRKRTTLIGYTVQAVVTIPAFLMVDSGNFWLFVAALSLWYVGIGVTYGTQAAWYVELFPASVRYTGTSIAYALGSILGGAFAPLIAEALTQAWNGIAPVAVYILVMTCIALVATSLLRDRPDIDLGIENEPEQQSGSTILQKRSFTHVSDNRSSV